MTPEAKLMSKIAFGAPDECWEWLGSRKGERYGRINVKGRLVRAHRFCYETFCGEIPHGLFVLHSCGNSFCLNPNHLYLGTQSDNMQDRKRHGTDPNLRKTRCKQGHPLSGSNVYKAPSGQRVCRECSRRWAREWQRKHRAAR